MGYRLFSDMTADVSDELMAGMPTVEFVPMQVEVGDESYTYGPEGDLTVEYFYAEQRGGKFASTSQINPMVYRECFEKALKAGEDVLYLCFSSGMSGTLLQIKPMLHVDEEGKLRVTEKPRGRKQAIRTQIAHMKAGWTPEMGKLVVVGHGDCPEDGEQLKQAVLKEFPDADIRMAYIGPVIGAHTGPGMLALIYWGNNR